MLQSSKLIGLALLTFHVNIYASNWDSDCVTSVKSFFLRDGIPTDLQANVQAILNSHFDSRLVFLVRKETATILGWPKSAIEDSAALPAMFCLDMLDSSFSRGGGSHYFFNPSVVHANLRWIASRAERWPGMQSSVTMIGLSENEQNSFCKEESIKGTSQKCLASFGGSENDLAMLDSTQSIKTFAHVLSKYQQTRDSNIAKILIKRFNDSLIAGHANQNRTSIRYYILHWFSVVYVEESWIRLGSDEIRFTYRKSLDKDASRQKMFYQKFTLWAARTFSTKPRQPQTNSNLWLTYSDERGGF